MSKFFQQDSSTESESDSDNEVIEVPVVAPKRKVRVQAFEDSDDEDDKKSRVVLSEKEKRYEEINGQIKQLKNAKKIKDIVKTNEIFTEMTKSYDKSKKVIEKEGHFKQFLLALSELEAFVNELWADATWKKSTGKNNASALTKLRQGIKKYIKDADIAKDVADAKSLGDSAGADEAAGSASASEGEGDAKGKKDDSDESSSESDDSDGGRKKTKDKDEDDDESSEWSSSESESDSSDSDIDYNEADIWKKFLKDDDAKGEKEDRKKDKKEKKDRKVRVTREEEEETDKPRTERPKLFAKDEDVNHESVVNKLNLICSGRGRKGTDRKVQMEMISELREIGKQFNLGPALDVKILINQIAINFDYNTRLNKSMKAETWNSCLNMLQEIMEVLNKNDNIECNEAIADDEENVADSEKPYKIKGCVLTINDRMVEEFNRILQQCDAHGSEYVERLKDEPKVCSIIDTLLAYMKKKGEKQQMCRIYLKKVENLYYKYDKSNESHSSELVDELCKFIYTNDTTDRLRTKAMLCHIYHNALHDRWFEARDLMLMSHLQESIDSSDVPLQILYNRTMVQVGLCAFRVGNIKEAHAALLDIQIGNRAKELLAQGVMVQRNVEKSKEQEMKERQRLIPFHMHINLELIECLYLVSAMLIEIPFMCSRDFETKKRMISKQFHYQLKISEKQSVVGPPENMREHVVAAAKAMRNGEWKQCIQYLINDKMNAKVWDLMPQSTNVKSMLVEKVKEESLRTYLFRYSSVYESISIQNLAQMFDLLRPQVYSIISKMIINEELMASLDQPTQTVVMHRTEPTKLQTLALQFSEKITNLMDLTERMITAKGGEMGGFLGRNQQGQSQQNQQRGDQGGRGNRGDQQNYKKNKDKQGNRDNRDNKHRGERGEYHHNRGGERGERGERGDRDSYREHQNQDQQSQKAY